LRRVSYLLLAPLLFQPALRGQDAANLSARLQAADAVSALDVAGLKPWHLQMAVQMFDAKGKPGEQGTIEEWWASPGNYKQVYTLPSYTATFVDADGKMFRTPAASHPPALLDVLLRQATHPMPAGREVDDAQPQISKLAFGKVPLECIMLSQPIQGLKSPPMGLFPTYCLDPGKDSLRLTYNFGTQLVRRNLMGVFQQKTVSTDLTVLIAGVTAAHGQTKILQTQELTSADLATDGLEPVGSGSPTKVAAGVIAGMALHRAEPIYPPNAKANHITGTVVLHAVIGTDGQIYDLSVQSSPDPELAIAAIAAVRRWSFKPYLLTGQPVEVETTINVNFNMR
jgi:TonB family protein